MPIEETATYLRVRVANPKRFVKFRTQDIGRKGHSKRLAGQTRRGKWETATWLINKQDLKKRDMKTLSLIDDILQELPRRDRLSLEARLMKIV